MSSLMEDAIAKARELPKEQQDAIAAMILEAIEKDWLWDQSFARRESVELLERLADEALKDVRAGRSRRLDRDPLIINAFESEGSPDSITEAHRQDLRRRLGAYRDDPKAGAFWEEVKARLQGREP